MTFRPAPIPRSESRPAAGVIAPWRAAAVALARSWMRAAPAERNENRRVVEAMGTLAFCGCVAFVGALYDARLTRWATKAPEHVMTAFAKVTLIGTSGWVFALTVVLTLGALLARGRGFGPRADGALAVIAGRAFFLFAVAAVSGLASLALKLAFGRARPKYIDLVGPLHFDAPSFDPSYASFPSGHAVTAFAMAVGVGAFAPRWRWPLLAVAALVGVSRVVLGAHYASDVLAGAALGFASAVLARRAFAARGIVFRRVGSRIVPRARGLVTDVVARGRA